MDEAELTGRTTGSPLRFLVKLVVFALPLVVVLAFPIGLAFNMGEAMPLRMIVARQMQDDPALFGPWDRDPVFAYKLMSVEARRPELLVIGSSRTLQFRTALFDKNPDAAYNAAAEAWGMADVRALMSHLPDDYAPRVVLFGMDQPWFNADYVDWEEPRNLRVGEDLSPARLLSTTRTLIDQLLAGDIRYETVLSRDEWVRGAEGFGLQALRFGLGYRNDGSQQQGYVLINPELGEEAREHDLGAAADGWRQFVQGNEVSEAVLAELDAFLAEMKTKGITVVGFSPPYMPSIYAVMMDGDKNEYIPKSAARIAAIYEAHGFAYFDFSNAEWVGGVDEELYDGWHSSELLCLRMYVAMLRELPEVLGDYSDLSNLERILAEADNPMEVFGMG